MGRLFTVLLATTILFSCTSQGTHRTPGAWESPGKYVGNMFVNPNRGYGFRVPPGWRPADQQAIERLAKEAPQLRALDFFLVGPDNASTIFGVCSYFPVPRLRSLGGDRTIVGEEKAEWMRLVVPGTDPKWYDKLTMEVATFGRRSFLMTYWHPTATVGDMMEVASSGGPPGSDNAAFANGDYSCSFGALMRDQPMRSALKQLLATIEFR